MIIIGSNEYKQLFFMEKEESMSQFEFKKRLSYRYDLSLFEVTCEKRLSYKHDLSIFTSYKRLNVKNLSLVHVL